MKVDNSMHLNFVCESPTDECFMNTCDFCADGLLIKELSTRITSYCQQISWSQWESASKEVSTEVDHINTYCNIEKKKKKGSLDDVFNEVYENLAEFLDHQYVKMKQSQSSADMISEALKLDAFKAVVICDFAEKFHCFYQNQPQSANFGQTPVSLFTTAVHHRKLSPIVIASDFPDHTKNLVVPYVDKILEQMPEKSLMKHLRQNHYRCEPNRRYST